jgi:hypothetical protein
MSLLSDIKSVFSPSKPPTIGQLAHGLCVLPAPKARHQAPKTEAAPDMYTINEVTQTYGFHSATAQRQNNGGIPELTGFDVTLLRERDLWGGPKNKAMHSKNAACKKCWHGGETEKEAGVILGKSESWVEKRYGTFSTALSQEISETEL